MGEHIPCQLLNYCNVVEMLLNDFMFINFDSLEFSLYDNLVSDFIKDKHPEIQSFSIKTKLEESLVVSYCKIKMEDANDFNYFKVLKRIDVGDSTEKI